MFVSAGSHGLIQTRTSSTMHLVSDSVRGSSRDADIRLALLLTYVAIGWMFIEAAAAVGAGIVAGSLLLVAFGIDSAIELASAVVVFRRFRIESHEKFPSDLEEAGAIERVTSKLFAVGCCKPQASSLCSPEIICRA
jgi:hypothetical protein